MKSKDMTKLADTISAGKNGKQLSRKRDKDQERDNKIKDLTVKLEQGIIAVGDILDEMTKSEPRRKKETKKEKR